MVACVQVALSEVKVSSALPELSRAPLQLRNRFSIPKATISAERTGRWVPRVSTKQARV